MGQRLQLIKGEKLTLLIKEGPPLEVAGFHHSMYLSIMKIHL
jgi:hypothetical protein